MSTPPAATDRGDLPVVVIGAGPVGLAAAAHLLERGLDPLVLEAGDQVGSAVRAWSHVRLFSPWRYDLDAAAVRLLEATGWTSPDPAGLPTGGDLVTRYLAPLAAVPALAPRIRTGRRVVAVSRVGMDATHSHGRSDRPFLVRTQGPDGAFVDHRARAVIDASGTWGRSNPLGAAGLPTIGETEAGDHLSGPLPDVLGADRARFAGRRVLVVGAGHSATNTLLDLVALAGQEPGTVITWAVRGASAARAFGGGDRDGLPARGALGSRLRAAVDAGRVELLTGVTITAVEASGEASGDTSGDALTVTTSSPAGDRRLPVDVVVPATGFRPDLAMLREVRLDLAPGVEAPRRLAPLIDPEFHSCGTVPAHGADVLAHPEPGFFIAGMKSYGRAPTFLLATGYEQVRSIAAALAGDAAAAADVRLDLPETGVCSSTPPADTSGGTLDLDGTASAGCCGGPVTAEPATLGFPTGLAHGRAGERAARR
ncbi:FAD-dependent oxidoreductase [Kineococcus sp. SYSU DK002]|uniref:FAD-dependent oxidoreductase n=1 Tax=Kineococcus sp. SYSU DK002 TaxID=3383123 RepID=UPI003D7ED5BC